MKGECCVTIIGDGVVGKTCFLLCYQQNGKGVDTNEYIPTVFDVYSKTIRIDERHDEIQLKLFDTAGQEDYDRLRQLAYNETDIFILCYAFDDKNSMDNIKAKWYKELAKWKCPIVLIGTKYDQIETEQQRSEHLKVLQVLAKEIKAIAYYATSAITGLNVLNVIDACVRYAMKKKKSKRKCMIL